jgi:vancomycin resistance protein YoaR
MGGPLRQPVADHVRRPEITRDRPPRREFRQREAKRHLEHKETPWAPIAYGVFFAAVLVIGIFAYTSYAFSKYRGEILPGTYVDRLNLSGMTEKQAESALTNQLAAIHQVPVQLAYHGFVFRPTAQELGLVNGYDINGTAKAAMQAGRTGSVLSQWLARMPIHPSHQVGLIVTPNEALIRRYAQSLAKNGNLYHDAVNAQLKISSTTGWHVRLVPAIQGVELDVPAAVAAIHDALGSLSIQTEELKVAHVVPAISDDAANRIRAQVENFLSQPPIIAVGRRVILVKRSDLGPMFSFQSVSSKSGSTINLTVSSEKLQAYVASLATTVDREPENAKLNFDAGHVQVVSPKRNGRTLDQADAVQKLSAAIHALKPNARLHFKVTVTTPPIDQSNPASLGISSPLGMGASSFVGAGPTRLADITQIAKALNNDLLPPDGDISFNTLVGTNWLDRVYSDGLTESAGQLVPTGSGAMQQVATTFLRALYASGLALEERHAHLHRLPFYEPPAGLDAVVAPARNWDLRFANTTHHYLLIETRVEPIRQELYIYVYGPKLGWHVSVDPTGKVLKVYPHGPQIERQDTSLAPGQVRQIAWPLDGAEVVLQRTITFPNGTVHTDQIASTYRPSAAILSVGSVPTATPVPKNHKNGAAAGTPTPTSPVPSPTPTFSH